jgi:aryl-alcohol dehydrogenase-like predicted oxidoreductase
VRPTETRYISFAESASLNGNLVDTADGRNGGVAEETLGRWFAVRPADVTDHVLIATKARTKTGEDPNEAWALEVTSVTKRGRAR